MLLEENKKKDYFGRTNNIIIMKKLLFPVLVLFTHVLFGQQINTLKYILKIKNPNKLSSLASSAAGDTLIQTQTGNYIKQVKKSPETKVQDYIDYMGYKIFDLKEKVALIPIEKRGYFYMDELDSFCQKQTIKGSGEQKVINGYNCEKYVVLLDEKYTSLFVSNKYSFKMDIWVTKDIDAVNNDLGFNSCLLTNNFSCIEGKGTIVKIEGETVTKKESQFYEINLIKADYNKDLSAEYDKPWQNKKMRFAVSDDSKSWNMNHTIESDWKRSARIGKRLNAITGEPTVKRVSVPYWDSMYRL